MVNERVRKGIVTTQADIQYTLADLDPSYPEAWSSPWGLCPVSASSGDGASKILVKELL